MKDLVLYIPGQGGSAGESEHYKPLFPGCAVMGLAWTGQIPRQAAGELRVAVDSLREQYGRIILIANSIGAYFSMRAGLDSFLSRAYFISPVVDLEQVILDMMARSGVTEQELRRKGEIVTPFGELLSWAYLCDVRANPPAWRAPTEILFGEADELSSLQTVSAFAKAHGAGLTVMPGGRHWFHTREQMQFLDRWISCCEAGGFERTGLETQRLRMYPAAMRQMEALIAAEQEPGLRAAYGQMLALSLQHPDQWDWYAAWIIEAKDGTRIGDLCFKGLGADGAVEIGYGILDAWQGQGYAAEAVRAACAWAFRQPGVELVEAETEPGNRASQRVLEKCGFAATGAVGEEGPRFALRRPS